MADVRLRELIERLWNEGRGKPFSDAALYERLEADGGHGKEGLTRETVSGLLDGKRPEEWGGVAVAMRAAADWYLVRAGWKMTREQAAAAAFAACALADAAREGERDWAVEHDEVMALLMIVRNRVGLAGLLPVLAYVFGKGEFYASREAPRADEESGPKQRKGNAAAGRAAARSAPSLKPLGAAGALTHGTLREVVGHLWSLGGGRAFSDEALFQRVSRDGGIDAEGLTQRMITDVLNERAPGDWHIVVFAFSELVAYYLAGEGPDMSLEQVAAAAFVSCVLADAARAGECDWQQHHMVTQLNALLAGRTDLFEEDLLPVTAYIYGKGGQMPMGEEMD